MKNEKRKEWGESLNGGALQFCKLPLSYESKSSVKIAYRHRIPKEESSTFIAPKILWLGGYRSIMDGEKARAIDAAAEQKCWEFLRFDYSGHGESGGDFAEGNLTQWVFEAEKMLAKLLASTEYKVLSNKDEEPPLLIVGSSMGAWIALLLAARFLEKEPEAKVNLLLIAPAADFTHHLLPKRYPSELWETLADRGVIYQKAYGENQPLYYQFVQDAEKHLILNDRMLSSLRERAINITILHGTDDEVIPLAYGRQIAEHLTKVCNNGEVDFQVVQQGDHRLSRGEDIAKIIQIIEGYCGGN